MANMLEEAWSKFQSLPTAGKVAIVAAGGGIVLLIWQPWKSSSSTSATSATTATPLETSSAGVASGAANTSQTGSSGYDLSSYPWLSGNDYTLTGSSAGSGVYSSGTSSSYTSGLSGSTVGGSSTASQSSSSTQSSTNSSSSSSSSDSSQTGGQTGDQTVQTNPGGVVPTNILAKIFTQNKVGPVVTTTISGHQVAQVTPVNKTATALVIQDATAGGAHVTANQNGTLLSVSHSYNSAVNSTGGQYINGKYVKGTYNQTGQFNAATQAGANTYNSYEQSVGSNARATVTDASHMVASDAPVAASVHHSATTSKPVVKTQPKQAKSKAPVTKRVTINPRIRMVP